MKKANLLLNISFYFLLILLISFLILPYIYADKHVFHLPFNLNLNHRNLVMVKGETVRLKVIGINKRVTFNTTDWKVADVNYNGWIKADKIGKATITAEVDNKKRRCVVRVIGLNKTSIKIKVGEKYKLKINGIISRVKYTSNNKEIALVDRKGIIKGIKKGRTTIYVEVKGKKLECVVNIN